MLVPKRLTLKVLRAFDEAHGECLVRWIEMEVDGLIRDQAYSIQFWRDVQLYGLAEAVTYLENSGTLVQGKSADTIMRYTENLYRSK